MAPDPKEEEGIAAPDNPDNNLIINKQNVTVAAEGCYNKYTSSGAARRQPRFVDKRGFTADRKGIQEPSAR